MSSAASQSAAQATEINGLKKRLSVVKTSRASKLEGISLLKTRHANQYTMLCEFRDELDRKDREAQFAHSSNQLREYRYKLGEIDNIGLQRARTMREWTELGTRIQDAHDELRMLDEEIFLLEQILDSQKAL